MSVESKALRRASVEVEVKTVLQVVELVHAVEKASRQAGFELLQCAYEWRSFERYAKNKKS